MAVEHLSLQDGAAPQPDLVGFLAERGIEASIISREADVEDMEANGLPHLALLDISAMPESEARQCVQRCASLKLPVVALVPEDRVADLDVGLGIDDFVVCPPRPEELVTRARQVLWRTRSPAGGDVIRVGDLVINPASYEVSLKGKRINLRFKEYELLRLLASSPGRVYSREALLSRIWGYDYFGGTRTVDVHIRRLRSKIEDAEHSFIETIWNVGYRFKNVERS